MNFTWFASSYDTDDIPYRLIVFVQMTGALISVVGEKLGKQVTPGVPNIEFLADGANMSVSGGQYFARLNYVFNLQDRGSAKFSSFISLPMARNMSSNFSMARTAAASQYSMGAPQQQQMGVPVRSVGFEPLQMGVASEAMGNIALLLDVPMRVTVELGRTKMTIKEILGLGEGSIIELDKLAGEPVDILVNDKLIAQGEVVVIDENFAVRVTKIVSPMERIFENTGEGKF